MALGLAIDNYLKSRGSPMAGQGSAFVKAGSRYGVDPRLLVGIATIESGAGQHLARPFNPFNWGIHKGQQYGSWDESIFDVARGLRQNYLDSGLDTPERIVSKYAPASDNNDEGNWASVVRQVMGKLGAPAPKGPTGAAPAPRATAAPPPPPPLPSLAPVFNRQRFGQGILQSIVANRGAVDYGALADLRSQAYETPAPAPTPVSLPGMPQRPSVPQPTKGRRKGAAAGSPVIGGSAGGEHGTSGLAGYSGVDWFAKAGSPAVAPVSGKVVKLSGHDPAQGAVQGAGGPLGWSVYIQADDGSMHYLTHMGSRSVRQGQRVEAGQQIGTVANYDKYGRASHIHYGVG